MHNDYRNGRNIIMRDFYRLIVFIVAWAFTMAVIALFVFGAFMLAGLLA